MGENEESQDIRESSYPRTQAREPLVLAVLVFLTVSVMVFGVFTMVQSVRSPFVVKSTPKQQVAQQVSEDQKPTLDLENLKSFDTDTDTLSDYDEITVYHTSPYLKDTDSDGYTDKEEIATGHDPLCGSRAPCSGAAPSASGRSSTVGQSQGAATTGQASVDANTPSSEIVASGTSLAQLESATPAQVREMLIKKGLPADKVNALDDTTLMNLYQQTLMEVKQKAPQQKTGISAGASVDPSAPLGMTGVEPTPDQIRAYLKSSGQVTDAQLTAFDDATLLDIFHEALGQQQAQQ